VNKAGAASPVPNSAPQKADDATVFIKSGPQTHQVKLNDILYLEKDGNYITVHLKDVRRIKSIIRNQDQYQRPLEISYKKQLLNSLTVWWVFREV